MNNQTKIATFCTKCGNELSPNSRFCTKCGEATINTTTFQSPRPLVSPQNKTTRTLNVISTIYYVFTGIALLAMIMAMIASLTGEPSIEIFLSALAIATSCFFQGILFSAIADIHNAVVGKRM